MYRQKTTQRVLALVLVLVLVPVLVLVLVLVLCRAVRLDLQPSAITADLFDAPLGLSSQQCTLSAASDKGRRAATLRQTTLRLNCPAQLAQSTSKSLSQNIVGKLRINKACNNKQLVATHSHAQLSDALMHTHTRPSAEAFGVAANGIKNAGRQGVSSAAWAMPAQQHDERNKAKTDNVTQALYSPPGPRHPSACKGTLFALTHESRGS